MKRIKLVILVVAFLVSLALPTVRLVAGPSLAGLELGGAAVYACEAPLPNGGCGGG